MKSKGTILVVEDTPADLELLADTLTAGGYQVQPADSGELALAAVAAQPPDLILLDIRMPVLDGFEVCRRLKARPESRDIPVVFISASGECAERVAGLKLGAVDYLPKPFEREELLARIRPHLEMHHLRVRLERQAAELRRRNEQLQSELTERKQAELEIQRQAAFPRFNPNPVLELCAAGEITYFNDATREMARALGLENPAQMLPPNTAGIVRECLAAGKPKLRVETQIGPRVFSWSFFPVKLNHTVHCYAGDITERKRAQEDLQFKNILLSAQQEASIDGMLVVDEAARILSYNRRFIELWRLPAKLVEDRVDEPVLQFVTAQISDPGSFAQRVQYLYEHRQETGRDELILADGRVLDRYSAPMFGLDGRYYGRVWYFRDMTDRKQMEEKLRQLSRAVEQSPASIVITAPAGDIEYVNPKFVEVTGYSLVEVMGKNPRVLKSGEKSPEAYQELWQTITAGKEWRGEFHNRKKTGELYWESASISPIRDLAGCITHYVAVKEDITARKQIEAERDQLIQELQKALASVKSLSGLLPICAGCKKIRDDKGYWSQVESYVQKHSEATFTHGLCPDCIKKYYGAAGVADSPEEVS